MTATRRLQESAWSRTSLLRTPRWGLEGCRGRNAWPEPSRCPGFESGYGKDVSELWPRR